jgi:hypothetical protein
MQTVSGRALVAFSHVLCGFFHVCLYTTVTLARMSLFCGILVSMGMSSAMRAIQIVGTLFARLRVVWRRNCEFTSRALESSFLRTSGTVAYCAGCRCGDHGVFRLTGRGPHVTFVPLCTSYTCGLRAMDQNSVHHHRRVSYLYRSVGCRSPYFKMECLTH